MTQNQQWNLSATENYSLNFTTMGVRCVEVGILVVIIVFGLIGNLSLCAMIYRTRQLQTVSNFLVINLSISDLFRIILSLTISTSVLAKRSWIAGDIFCQVNGFYTLLFLSSSLLSVTLITLNRYYLVVKPNKAKTVFSKRNAKVMLIFLWCLSVLSAIPPVFGMGKYGFVAARATCFIEMGSTWTYTSLLVIVLIATPFSLMIWCYVKVYVALLRSKKRVINELAPTTENSVEVGCTREMKVAQTVLVLVGVYIITWIPVFVLHFIRLSRAAHVPYHVDLLTAYLIGLSCVTNPWIYGSKHKQFYEQLRTVFCLKWTRDTAQGTDRHIGWA